MLALVRKAYGSGCRVEITSHSDGSARVVIYSGAWIAGLQLPAEVYTYSGPSLGHALAAALLAAPPPSPA
jgi:hypothetical protein